MTASTQTPRPPERTRATVSLRDLAVAPENLRFAEPPDDQVPELAATIRAAGVMQPLTVRPGRGRKEAPYMALDGRRRLLALGLLAEAGEIDGDYPVDVFVETEPARQAAAVVLTNTAAPVHIADVVAAIGRMLKARLTPAAIAGALGYDEVEIRRLAALASLPETAIAALRAGRLTLRQARLLARLSDRKTQGEIARLALEGRGFQEWRVREALDAAQVDLQDPRLVLVGLERYREAGGRIEADLFGELPDRLLDPGVLAAAWEARAASVARRLEREGLTVLPAADPAWDPPDDLESFGYVARRDLTDEDAAVHADACARHDAAVEAARALESAAGDIVLDALAEVCRTRIAVRQAGAPGRLVTTLVLRPDHDLGLDVVCLGPPPDVEKEDEDQPDTGTPGAETETPGAASTPRVDVEGLSHAQHRARTEIAGYGLMRAVADQPDVALIGLAARLFDILVLGRRRWRDGASAISAEMRRPADARSVAALNAEVERRLAARRDAFEASDQASIDWVASLGEADRAGLLAELFAVTLDLREERTDRPRPEARDDARRLARLSGAELAAHWTPDAVFLAVHGRSQLIAMLQAMDASAVDEGARKMALVDRVAVEAAARRWVPAALRWPAPGDEAA